MADSLKGYVGPDIRLHFNTDAVLLNVQGNYNLAKGDVAWMLRGQIVFGQILGVHDTHNLTKSISESPSSPGYVTRTTTYYQHKFVPLYIGLTVGFALWSVRTNSYTDPYGTSVTRDAALLPTLEGGFAIQSPQAELAVLSLYELNFRSPGIRWVLGMALPVGAADLPFAFKFSGDHFFGSNPQDNSGPRLGSVFLASLCLGSSLGAN